MAVANNRNTPPAVVGAATPAKRKRRKVAGVKKTPKRAKRRKMGSTGTMGKIVESVIAAAGGAFIARTVEANIPAPTDATKTDLRPYAGVVIGAMAVYFGKKDWQKAAGFGAIGMGAMQLIPDKSIPKLINGVPTSIGAPQYIRIPNRRMNQRRINGNGNQRRFNVVGMNQDGF